LQLKESDKRQLQQWVSAFGTPQQVAVRCRIVLDAAEGVSVDQMAARWETNRKTVMLWRKRFETEGGGYRTRPQTHLWTGEDPVHH
jgi:hypothetical protein